MKLSVLSLALIFGVLPVIAQPRITKLSNAASYAAAGLPNAAIAQGSIFVIEGSDLGPATLVQADTYPLQAELAGTRVRVSAGGRNLDAIPIYTSARQLAAIVPSDTPVGAASATVTYNNQTSAPTALAVARASFGIFTLNSAGSGPGVITNADFAPITFTTAANPSQAVIIWGTGLGAVNYPDSQRPQAGDLPADVEVYFGGKLARVLYKGRAPCCAGLDQIVAEIPADVGPGCGVSVVVLAGAVASNFTSTAVARTGRTCSDPNGFSESDLSSGLGNLTIGSINLQRAVAKTTLPGLGSVETTTETGTGLFLRFDSNALIRSSTAAGYSLGSCIVWSAAGSSAAGPADPVRTPLLDAGPVLNVNGPGGARQLAKRDSGYSANIGQNPPAPNIPGLFLQPGEYRVDNGAGGADVGPFTATLRIPAILNWTNETSITNVPRSQPLTVTWSGGDAGDAVAITGASVATGAAAGFYCLEQNSAGRFTVPAYVLSALPASLNIAGTATGFLSVGLVPVNPVRFTARGLSYGSFTYSMGTGKNLNYQ